MTSAKPTNSADDAVPAFNPVSFTRVFTNNSFRLLFIIIVCLSFVPSISAEQRRVQLTEEEQKFLQSHPVIRLGTDESWAPFVSRNANGELEGFDIDCLNYINETTGANIQLVTGQWADIVEKAKRHEIDGLATSAPLGSRKPFFDFSDVYISEYIIIFTRSDSDLKIRGLGDLSGKTVVTHKGNEAYTSLLKPYPDINIVEADSEIAATKMMLEGKGDVSIAGTSVYNEIHSKFLQSIQISYVVTEKPLDIVYSIRKDWPELTSIINKSLGSMPPKLRDKIYHKWFREAVAQSDGTALKLTKEERAWLEEKQTICYAVDPDWMPLEAIRDGHHIGMAADYFKLINHRIPAQFRLEVTQTWDESLQRLKDRECDLLSFLNRTDEREKYLKFTTPFLRTPQVIVTRSDVPFVDGYDGLHGLTIVVTKGYKTEDIIKEQHPEIQMAYVENQVAGLHAVSEGRAFAIIGSLTLLNNQIKIQGLTNLKIAGTTSEYDEFRVGIRSDAPLLHAVFQKAVDSITEEEINEIYSKWTAIEYTTGRDYSMLWKILAVVALIFLIIGYWNRRMAHEIIARKKVEEKLRKLSRAVEQSHSTIVITNLDANIEFANPAFTKATGYTLDEALQQNPRILKSDEHDAAFYRSMWDTLTRGEVWQGEMCNKRKDGSTYWEFASISPVKDEEGKTTHYVAVKEDITERKEMETELVQSRERAKAANRAKSEFLANMSHELRTPLNAILGYTQLFAGDSSLTPKQQDGIQTMHHSGEHLLLLINDILDLSKIEAGRMELVTTEFCLPGFLQHIVNIIEVRANEKGLTFHYEPEKTLPSFVEADAVRLRQVILNLLSNAVKYTNQGHCALRVLSQPVNENRVLLTFTIEDSGVGINSDMQEKVFDPFKQVGDQLQHAEGTGLGLSISRTLIQLMNGTLLLVSPINKQPTADEGPGCCFSFAIEVRVVSDMIVVDQEKRKVTGYIIPGGQNVRKKILIVDDNISNRAVLRDTLEPLGFNINEATDGSEVLAVCQGFQPDAILMDLRMPKMDGFSATKQVKGHEDFVDTPIIAITASSGDTQNLKQHCVESGFSGFLTKPFVVTELLDTLADQLHIELRYSEDTKEPLNELEIVPPRSDILDNLVKLARSGDINAVSEQAAKLAMSESGKYKAFAHRIEELAENFQLIEIVKLISMYEKE